MVSGTQETEMETLTEMVTLEIIMETQTGNKTLETIMVVRMET